MCQQTGFTFIQILLIALIPSVITGLASYLVFHLRFLAFKRDTMAERTAKHYLKHKRFTDRSFKTLKKYLGGWDNEPDELRKILVRAGAIRTYRTENNGNETEWWTLLSRVPEKIKKRNKKVD